MPTLALALLLAAGLSSERGTNETAEREPLAVERRYVVERIRLEGLQQTRPSEVLRHLTVTEGQLLDDQAVLVSRLRLLQLGWFSRVDTRVEKGSERGLVVLVFDFTERNTLIISDLVLGSTPPQRIYGGLGLSELNFLGLGLALSGAFVYGGSPAGRPLDPSRFAAHGNFFAPDIVLDGLPLVFGVSAIALRGEELTCPDPRCDAFRNDYGNAPRLRYERFGGDIAVGIRPGPFERLLAGYRMEHLEASTIGSAVPSGASGPLPFLRLGRSTLAALTGSYDRDTRNDLFFPTGGTRLSLAIVFASKVLGSDYDYSRYLLQLESDHRLLFGHALKLLGAAGAVQGEAPFFERFYPADFAYFSIGPALGRALELNFSTDSRYDSYLGMVGAEYGIPLWSHGQFFHRGYLALGVRWLYSTARAGAPRTTASSTPFSGDVALRLDTPVGSFNFSAAYALDNFL